MNERVDKDFDVTSYLTKGVERIVKEALMATFTNPKESMFLGKFSLAAKTASKKRKEAEEKKDHIPPFLIASITSSCNLHCSGCYARMNQTCTDEPINDQLTKEDWKSIFLQSKELGISFILLAGGEPMMRRDVISIAARIPEILFPIFTNGTMLDQEYVNLFDTHRNLVPILSLEGNENITDQRRGKGIYKKVIKAMEIMNKRQIFFGVSITVTKENISEVTQMEYLNLLEKAGGKVVFFIEYVPVTEESKELALGEIEREYLKNQILQFRTTNDKMVYISFPGDEKTSGGCLAAGRGFFHINAKGGAEPCPFSPYSDINVKDTSVKEALSSRLFTTIQSEELLREDHAGGCVLFERQEQVKAILNVE